MGYNMNDLQRFAQTGDFGYLGYKDSREAWEAGQAAALSSNPAGSSVSAGGQLSASPGNSSGITNFHASPVDLPPAPGGPNLNPLKKSLEAARNKEAIDKAMKEYDDLEASTRASGFQSAESAGNIYSARLMQAGINPVASGVVTAQAKLPIYKQVAEIGKEREQTRLDATSRADALAAQIAGQIAQLQLGYANTLANYNANKAGYELDYSKFNAGQDLNAAQLAFQMSQYNNSRRSANSSNIVNPGAGAAPFSGMMTRIPNSSAAGAGSEYTPQFKEYLNAIGRQDLIRQGPMQYPQSTGIGSGGDVDTYQAWQRNMANVADPSIPAYNVNLIARGGSGNAPSTKPTLNLPDWYKQYIS